jgi:hypothetical protein
MIQEDKELLLQQDLCGRLPYGVKIETEYFTKATLVEIRKNISYGACKDLLVTYDISGEETPYQSEQRSSTISKIKPYLFPLSSMTEEQKIIYGDLCYAVIHSLAWDMQAALNELIDWLNKNHFDYRGLIEKGLAIDATELNIY